MPWTATRRRTWCGHSPAEGDRLREVEPALVLRQLLVAQSEQGAHDGGQDRQPAERATTGTGHRRIVSTAQHFGPMNVSSNATSALRATEMTRALGCVQCTPSWSHAAVKIPRMSSEALENS